MENKSREAVIEKVQKILARADASRNDNENERATAIRQANALLAKYNLSMEDCETETLDNALGAREHTEFGIKENRTFIYSIYQAIGELYNVELVTERRRGNKKVHLIGRQVNIKITKQISEYVYDSVVRESERLWKRDKPTSYLSAQRYKNSFCSGAAYGVSEQVDRMIKEMKAAEMEIDGQKISQSQALVLVNQRELEAKENKRKMAEEFPNIRQASCASQIDQTAYGSGAAYGESINLNQQLGNQRRIARGKL